MVAIRRRRPLGGLVGHAAPRLRGTDLEGKPLEVVTAGKDLTLLFLSSGCRECVDLWRSLQAQPPREELIVVTPGAGGESRRRLHELMPPGATVVMSSEAWHDFGVGPAPWLVTVAGGRIVTSRRASPAHLEGCAAS